MVPVSEMPGDEISQNSDGSDEENNVEMVNDGESICGSTTSNSEKGLKQISHQVCSNFFQISLSRCGSLLINTLQYEPNNVG